MKNKIVGFLGRNKIDIISLLLAALMSAIIKFGILSCFLYYCFLAGFFKLLSKFFSNVLRIKIVRVAPEVPELKDDSIEELEKQLPFRD